MQRFVIWHRMGNPQFVTDVRASFIAALTLNELETSHRVEIRELPVVDSATLSLVDAVVIQRPCNGDAVNIIAYYSRLRQQYNFNIVLEFDDILWEIYPQLDGLMEHIAPGIDYAVVTNRALKENLEKTYGIRTIIVPNLSADHLIHRVPSVPNRILYAGNGNHSKDFNDEWKKALNDIQRQGWEFHTLGDEIPGIGSINHPPVNTWNFGRTLNSIAPSIYIAPLNPDRIINRYKSNLKYVEASTMGSVFLGSHLPLGGPYNYINDSQRVTNENAKEIIERIQYLQANFSVFVDFQDEYLRKKHLAMTDKDTLRMWLASYILGEQQQIWR